MAKGLNLDEALGICVFLETLLIKEAKVVPGDTLRDVVENKNGYFDNLKGFVSNVPGISFKVDDVVAEHVVKNMIMGLVTLMEAIDRAKGFETENSNDPGELEIDEWKRRGGGGEGNGETFH